MKLIFKHSPTPIISPNNNCEWADTMVLNPTIFKVPDDNNIHMLFRATGTYKDTLPSQSPCPYPSSIGYAVSYDGGLTFLPDFTKPALAPLLKTALNDLYIKDIDGNFVINYANGSIEDPRVMVINNEYYLSVACRLFPAGEYWNSNHLSDFIPEWVHNSHSSDGFKDNRSVTVLYKINTKELLRTNYESAFSYVGPLTNIDISDDRDAYLFPQKLLINDLSQYVMIHRPEKPSAYSVGRIYKKPSIFISCSESLTGFSDPNSIRKVFATSILDWENERIGGSFPPISIGNNEWLISYHGKENHSKGYFQSFMIAKNTKNNFPEVLHRCPEKLVFPTEEWEMPDLLPCPCIFTCGGIVNGRELIMSYGAGDQNIGILRVDFKSLVSYVKDFDKYGRKIYFDQSNSWTSTF